MVKIKENPAVKKAVKNKVAKAVSAIKAKKESFTTEEIIPVNTDNEPEIVDMASVYATPTENSFTADFSDEITETTGEETEPEPVEYADQFDESEEEEFADEAVSETADENSMSDADTANFYITFVDVLQQPFIKEAIRKQRFSKTELAEARQLFIKEKEQKATFTDLQRDILQRYKNLIEDLKQVPFSADEKKQIRVSLIPCLKKWKGTPPPEFFLVIALMQIGMARLALIKAA